MGENLMKNPPLDWRRLHSFYAISAYLVHAMADVMRPSEISHAKESFAIKVHDRERRREAPGEGVQRFY
jgi:hypothetical protein